MKRHTSIPAAAENGLYWYYVPGAGAAEPVLVGTWMGDGEPAQMIKRFDAGRQRYVDEGAFLVGPVQAPHLEGFASAIVTRGQGKFFVSAELEGAAERVVGYELAHHK